MRCASISVVGPPGVPIPGELLKYEAKIDGSVPTNVEYQWTVAGGNIVDGQGTSKIKVSFDSKFEGTIMATVEVLGFASDCPNTASEAVPIIACFLYPILIDEFHSDLRSIEKVRLHAAAEELRNNPNDILYLIEYFPRRTSNFDIRDRQRRLMEFFTKVLKVDESVVKIISAESVDGRLLIKVYRMPPGAEYPEP